MKNSIRSLLSVLGAVSICGGAAAQSINEYLMFSQYDYGFGTARTAAMGGAFTSLGADLSSMSLNPAGLGMYRSSEVGISPSLSFGTFKTSPYTSPGSGINTEIFNDNTTKTRPALNNGGVALNLYEGTGAVTSVTAGLAYNRMANYNRNLSISGRSGTSMIDYFGSTMGFNGVVPPSDGGSIDNFGPINTWGGALAYNTYLLNYYNQGGGDYWSNYPGLFDLNAVFDSHEQIKTTGGADQIDLGVGMNISNILYLGVSLGIQSVYYKEEKVYREAPLNNSSNLLRYYDYVRRLEMTGTAWNFKFGATVMPLEGLRIGASIHTPTYISMEEWYAEDMYSYYNRNVPNTNGSYYWDGVERGNNYRFNFRTPARFNAGISYTFGPYAILSFDWERVWYNKIKTFADGWSFEDTATNNSIETTFEPTNNFRVGAEVSVVPGLFVRGGFADYGSMYRNEDWGQLRSYSGGLGYRSSTWGIDIAYVYRESKDAPNKVFQNDDYWSASYQTKNIRNMITLTGVYRFSL